MKHLLLSLFLIATTFPVHASVALHTATQSYEFGSGGFYYSFFSTVSANLEPAGWGSRFPTLMKRLFAGRVAPSELATLRQELISVQEELKRFPPSKIVWNFQYREQRPPWGNEIDGHITDLSNYFVTSDGQDLFQMLFQVIVEAEREKGDIYVE